MHAFYWFHIFLILWPITLREQPRSTLTQENFANIYQWKIVLNNNIYIHFIAKCKQVSCRVSKNLLCWTPFPLVYFIISKSCCGKRERWLVLSCCCVFWIVYTHWPSSRVVNDLWLLVFKLPPVAGEGRIFISCEYQNRISTREKNSQPLITNANRFRGNNKRQLSVHFFLQRKWEKENTLTAIYVYTTKMIC